MPAHTNQPVSKSTRKTVDTARPALPQDIVSLIEENRRNYRLFVHFKDPTVKASDNQLVDFNRRKIAAYS